MLAEKDILRIQLLRKEMEQIEIKVNDAIEEILEIEGSVIAEYEKEKTEKLEG